MGCENWEKCTGQGLRALAISRLIEMGLPSTKTAALAHHSSLNSQKPCARETNTQKHNRHMAMRAVHENSNRHGKELAVAHVPVEESVDDVPVEEKENQMSPHSNSALPAKRRAHVMNFDEQNNNQRQFSSVEDELNFL